MDCSIVIAHPLPADEALALIVEPTGAFVFDLDDCTVAEGRVVGERTSIVCWMDPEAAARISGHRVSLELEHGGAGDGSEWAVSIRGRAEIDAPGAPLVGPGAAPAGVVAVRVRPDQVRGTRFTAPAPAHGVAVPVASEPEGTA